MTKQRNNAEILEFLLPKLKNDGIVCTTQNGFPEESVGEMIGKERTFGGVASFGATFLGGGMVALTSKIEGMQLQISPLIKTQETKEKLELLKEILSYVSRATGNDNFVRETENLAGARWSKLAINAAFSGLSVATGLTFGEIAKKRKTRKLALGILRECMDVANASGIKLAPMQGHNLEKLLGGRKGVKRIISYLVLPIAMKKHKKLVSGMLKDVENGKKCEIDYINGAVVREGKRAGVATPLCEKVVSLVHDIENGLCEIDYRNVDFF
jgi:2-dehydropantoate 2-reductase